MTASTAQSACHVCTLCRRLCCSITLHQLRLPRTVTTRRRRLRARLAAG